MGTTKNRDKYSSEDKPDRKQGLREMVNLLLPDGLMIVLAVIMIPIVLIPVFVDLSSSWDAAVHFLDYAILFIFVLEYLLKTIVSRNIRKHVLNSWHLLDLFVIVVPLVNLLPIISSKYGSTTLILRLARVLRVVAASGRALDRKVQLTTAAPQPTIPEPKQMEIQVVDGMMGNVFRNIPLSKVGDYIASPSQVWIDISSVSEADFDRLSSTLGVPRILLESELVDESYPRIDYFEHYSLIFTRIADFQITPNNATRLSIDRKGILVICQGSNIITISKTKTNLFNQVIEQAGGVLGSEEPMVVTILYAVLKYILRKDKQIIAAMEQELMNLENIPLSKRPRNFLEITFYLRKEVNQLVPSLLHLKEIISVITSKRVPLEGFSEKHQKIFGILADETSYLYETATNARDNLQSLVDLYINTTSYETNKVMRMIALISCLGIIPAVIGLLGSNILGQPFNVHLWQVFGLLGISMLIMGWVFYRLGWLKI